jgi:hypothetical protein
VYVHDSAVERGHEFIGQDLVEPRKYNQSNLGGFEHSAHGRLPCHALSQIVAREQRGAKTAFLSPTESGCVDPVAHHHLN